MQDAVKVLSDQIRETAFAIHVFHGHGHLEKVYENALAHRLRETGLSVKQQHPIKVFDEDGQPLGEYFADLLVADTIIVELKTAKVLGPEHEAQILGYLKSARMEHGILNNFGSYKFQTQKFALSSKSDLCVAGNAAPLLSAVLAFFAVSASR